MKSLKARFKKADVSGTPGDTGTCPWGSQGCEDPGTFLGMPPVAGTC